MDLRNLFKRFLSPQKDSSTASSLFTEDELLPFNERISELANWVQNLDSLSNIPDYDLFITNYAEESLFYYGSLLANLGKAFAWQSIQNFILIWNNQLYSNLALPVRFIFEIWSSLHYFREILEHLSSNFDNNTIQRYLNLFEDQEIAEIIDRRRNQPLPSHLNSNQVLREYLNLSRDIQDLFLNYVRFNRRTIFVPLPHQFNYTFQYIRLNVMRRSLARRFPHADDVYSFLSEACHPNFYRLSGFTLRQSGLEILERTFQELENSLEGILDIANEILNFCLPHFAIEED